MSEYAENKSPLREIKIVEIIRLRSRICHAFSLETYLEEQYLVIEKSIWATLQGVIFN